MACLDCIESLLLIFGCRFHETGSKGYSCNPILPNPLRPHIRTRVTTPEKRVKTLSVKLDRERWG
jgi:hypothetical protein